MTLTWTITKAELEARRGITARAELRLLESTGRKLMGAVTPPAVHLMPDGLAIVVEQADSTEAP